MGVLDTFAGAGATLAVSTIQALFFVEPDLNATEAPVSTDRADDHLKYGWVKLTLRRKQRVSAITVRVGGDAVVALPGREKERFETLSNSMSIDIDAELEAGEHQMEFAFLLPSSSA